MTEGNSKYNELVKEYYNGSNISMTNTLTVYTNRYSNITTTAMETNDLSSMVVLYCVHNVYSAHNDRLLLSVRHSQANLYQNIYCKQMHWKLEVNI